MLGDHCWPLGHSGSGNKLLGSCDIADLAANRSGRLGRIEEGTHDFETRLVCNT